MEELYQGPIEEVKAKEVEFIDQYKQQGVTLYNVYHNNITRKKHNPYITSEQTIDTDIDMSDTSSDTSNDTDHVMVSDGTSSDEDFI